MIINITLFNTCGYLTGDNKSLYFLRKFFRIKHPNAFHIRRYMGPGWDGYVYYINEIGLFKIGMLVSIVNKLKEDDIPFKIIDKRTHLKPLMIKRSIGNKKFRFYQMAALRKLQSHRIGNIPLPVGVINGATNFGKTPLLCGIYKSYKDPICLILINDSNLYNQFKREFPELLPDDTIGWIKAKELKAGNITIAMVQTLANNINRFKNYLSKVTMLLVDECDLHNNKSSNKVFKQCKNAYVTVGLSGTVFINKKNKLKNNNLQSIFGEELIHITKLDLVKWGYSTKPIIKILEGNIKSGNGRSYEEEYEDFIVQSIDRNTKILNRVKYNLSRGNMPIIVMCKLHKHVDILYDLINKHLNQDFSISKVHHKTPDKERIIEAFREGRIDVLVSSLMLKRGQNMPLIKVIINASGGDSNENISQIMGRGERKHESKDKVYVEDFWDTGTYLQRHSKHRLKYYQKEQFTILELYAINN